MYNLKSLDIKNLMSHKHTYYEFNKNKTVPIFGRVIKNNGKRKSNGAGKSSLFEGIMIAFTGSSTRNVLNSEIVRNGYDYGEIELTIESKVLNKIIKIYRKIYSSKKSAECIIWVNNVEQTQLSDSNVKKNFIFNELGISNQDFGNYFLINKDNYTSFLSASNTDKINTINRFSKANKIDLIEPQIREDVDKVQFKIDKIQKEIISINAKIEVYQDELKKYNDFDIIKEKEDAIDKLEDKQINLKESINDFNIKIIEANKIILEKEETLINILPKKIKEKYDELLIKKEEEIKLSDKIKKLRNNIRNIENEYLLDEKQKIDNDRRKYNEDIVRINKELLELNNIQIDLEKEVQEIIECPKCQHNFNLKNPDSDIESIKLSINEGNEIKIELEKEKKDCENNIIKIGDRKKEYQNKIDNKKIELENTLSKLNDEDKLLSDLIDKLEKDVNSLNRDKKNIFDTLNETKSYVEKINNKILEVEKEIEEIALEIEEVNNNIIDPRININNNIEVYANKLLSFEEGLEKEIKNKQDVEEWLYIFKKFKSYLANKSISAINGYVNMYLKKMGTDTQVEIEGFKILKSGKIKEELDIKVIREENFGESESIAKFSGGERANIDLAFILTMQRLINNSSDNGGINFIGIDEILESVDETGIEDIVSALNNLNETVYLITHVKFESNKYDNYILVENKNGVSKLIQ